MRFAEDRAPADFVIQSCSSDGLIINDQRHTESVLLLPAQPLQVWPAQADTLLTLQHFSSVLACQPELLLLGTGPTLKLPDPEIYGTLLEQKIGLEAMTTAAACRTYNLLAQDGRKVAAGLILPA